MPRLNAYMRKHPYKANRRLPRTRRVRSRFVTPGRQLVTKRQLNRVTALDRKKYKKTGTVDTGNSAAYDDNTIFNVLANVIPTGTKAQKLDMQKITARFRYSNLANAGAAMVRTIIFQWHASTDDAPIYADILATVSPTQWDFLSPINYSVPSGNRFTILKDYMVRLGEESSLDGNDEVYKKFVIPGKRLRKLLYSEDGASIEGRNSVYMIVTSPVAVTGNPPLVDWWFSMESVQETFANA